MKVEANRITQENDLNITKAIAILTEQVVVEEDKLRQMREKSVIY
jgi:hypothetical protein